MRRIYQLQDAQPAPEHRFSFGAAVYNAKGEKLGWVQSTIENYLGVRNNQKAIIQTPRGKPLQMVTADLVGGIFFTKAGLRLRGIARQSMPTLILPGNRLYEGTLFRGVVTRVTVSEISPRDFACHTNLSQAVTSESFLTGRVTVGQRQHPLSGLVVNPS